MQPAHETLPRGRSPFAAAFLSLVFPGLGHVYLGAYRRGLGFAAPPLLAAALVAGFAVRMTAFDLAGLAVQSWFQIAVFVGNLVALVYRAAAIVDAWSIARMLGGRAVGSLSDRSPRGRHGLHREPVRGPPGHERCPHRGRPVRPAPVGDDQLHLQPGHGLRRHRLARRERQRGRGHAVPGDGRAEHRTCGDAASVVPQWNGKDRLNILLIGADEQQGGHRTDTMITVSIDPTTGQVVMFQLPRDTVDVPVPPGPARSVYGSTYYNKINGFLSSAANRPDAFPGTKATRGYTGLKSILGYLYGLDIQYYVEVNFEGFQKVVDALGGVTVNVQIPVLDDNFPEPGAHRERLYVPAGVQHMTGVQALEYSRSRKSTSDFDRAARQQRVIVSLRRQLDIGQALQNIDTLAAAIGQSVRTDIPRELVPQLLGLAEKVDTRSIESVIFTPPYYQTECMNCPPRGYIIQPNVSRIRQAVIDAFNTDPAFTQTRDALAQEGAALWVLNGSGRTGEAARLADYLSYLGLAATAPNQRPDTRGLSATTVRAYNGAVDKFPLTVQQLTKVFGVTIVPITDAAVHVDFEIITGGSTPQLTPPPVP